MLDYQRDINPIKGNFFSASAPSPNLRTSEIEMMNRQFAPDEDRLLDQAIKVSTFMDQKRNSALRYEANILSLQRARDQAAKDRETYAKLPSFFGELQGVMNNPELSPYEQQAHMAGLGMKYPMLLSTNRAAGTMLDSASKSIDMKSRYQAAQDKAALDAQSDREGKIKGAIPDYDRAITDIRKLSDKLEPENTGIVGGAVVQTGGKKLSAADKVVARSYAKSYLQYTDEDFDELYNSQGERGALLSILRTLTENKGVMTSEIRGVNVVPKGTYDDPNKYRASSPQ